MKLFSFQSNDALHTLEKIFVYFPYGNFAQNPSFLDSPSFLFAYSWLIKKMQERNISYQFNSKNMIWSWFLIDGVNKIDKRKSFTRNFQNKPFALLELDIPEQRLLLSDFDAWHYVLNYWPINIEEKNINFDFYQHKPYDQDFHKYAHPLEHQKILDSWNLIFDLKKSSEILEISSPNVQATFFEIFSNDVKKIHIFE